MKNRLKEQGKWVCKIGIVPAPHCKDSDPRVAYRRLTLGFPRITINPDAPGFDLSFFPPSTSALLLVEAFLSAAFSFILESNAWL